MTTRPTSENADDKKAISLRDATATDEPAIAACVDAAYEGYIAAMGRTPAPMLDDYQRLIEQGLVSIAERAGQLLGLIVMWSKGDHLYVDNIAVHPTAQGLGAGSRLLTLAEQQATAGGLTEIRLYTNEVMASNIDFYLRRGFVETHRAVDDGYRRIYFSRRLPVG